MDQNQIAEVEELITNIEKATRRAVEADKGEFVNELQHAYERLGAAKYEIKAYIIRLEGN